MEYSSAMCKTLASILSTADSKPKGLERQLRDHEHGPLLWRTWVQLPEPTSGSQPSVSLIPGHLMFTFDLSEHRIHTVDTHLHIDTYKHTHIHLK